MQVREVDVAIIGARPRRAPGPSTQLVGAAQIYYTADAR